VIRQQECVAIYKTFIQMIHIEIPKERDRDSSQVTDQDQDQLGELIENGDTVEKPEMSVIVLMEVGGSNVGPLLLWYTTGRAFIHSFDAGRLTPMAG
jgi:hypothetical protein